MKVVYDTNVILDVLANRMPFADDSHAATSLAFSENVEGAITSNCVTDIAYQLRRVYPSAATRTILLDILSSLSVISVSHDDCLRACASEVDDFEDALMMVCAQRWGADRIITRDKKDFAQSSIPALTPTTFLVEMQGEASTL